MVLEINSDTFINVDEIVAMRWLSSKNRGLIVFNGERMSFEKEEFNLIRQAFLWLHKEHTYGKDYKLLRYMYKKGEYYNYGTKDSINATS